jgi:hypothetical protein
MWVLLAFAWVMVAVCIGLAIGRWFKWMRDEDAEERRNARDWHG